MYTPGEVIASICSILESEGIPLDQALTTRDLLMASARYDMLMHDVHAHENAGAQDEPSSVPGKELPDPPAPLAPPAYVISEADTEILREGTVDEVRERLLAMTRDPASTPEAIVAAIMQVL